MRSQELVVDNFAGGGGASTGIEAALGRSVDLAVNHDEAAIRMHRTNHPTTIHHEADIWDIDPSEACGGIPVGLAWFSPDCTHFSRAKGEKPVSAKVRGLAWVVTRWAAKVSPRVIMLENVAEFETWGPIDSETQRPIKERMGQTFRKWVRTLEDLGYVVEWRNLCAADYGAPTSRKRLFVIARRDGQPIVWPAPTHGPKGKLPWRQAAEIIDWAQNCPSIFLDAAEGKRQGVRRPLAHGTLQRIALGVKRFVIEAKQPFIVRHGHYSTKTGVGLVHGAGAGVFRGQSLESPIATICATNDKNLVMPHLLKHYGGMVGSDLRTPIGTITAVDHHSLGAALLTKHYGTSHGADAVKPLPTVTAKGNHLALTEAMLEGATRAGAGGRAGQVFAFLAKYYGSKHHNGQSLADPIHTIVTKDRFALVQVAGEQYRIDDIGMRMLSPGELYAGQGFPKRYRFEADSEGVPFTKRDQIRLAGNSVCPALAEALVRANVQLRRVR